MLGPIGFIIYLVVRNSD
ncbi:hypothetical protein [Bacillus tianshenii]|nr:hypothetical protein [Bacillus tianshenii]